MFDYQRLLFLSLFFLCSSADFVKAQRGWYLGANTGYDQLAYDGKKDKLVGSTYDLDFGYYFNDSFGVISSIGGSFYEGGKSKRGSIDLGPRFILYQGEKIQPFLDLVASVSTVDNGAFNFSRNGFGASGSTGIHYFLNDAIALKGIASISRVYYNDVKFAGLQVEGLEEIGTYFRIRAGIAFYFR